MPTITQLKETRALLEHALSIYSEQLKEPVYDEISKIENKIINLIRKEAPSKLGEVLISLNIYGESIDVHIMIDEPKGKLKTLLACYNELQQKLKDIDSYINELSHKITLWYELQFLNLNAVTETVPLPEELRFLLGCVKAKISSKQEE